LGELLFQVGLADGGGADKVRVEGQRKERGDYPSGREDESYAEEQDLSVLATEECNVNIIIQ
jgi:hypothetical protein